MMKLDWRMTLLGLLLIAGIGVGVATHGESRPLPADGAVATAQDLSVAFRRVGETVLPSIVTIETVQTSEVALRQPAQFPDDELFRRFFGDDFQERFQQQAPQQRQQRGQGSGFVIDSKGIILTNSHVVNGADKVTLRFQDGQEIVATEWKTDPWTDVAIVRFTPVHPVAAIPLGNSDQVEIGDWVLAFGDPFGVGTSMTAGIISGKARAPHINDREEFLQTDAAINPGNSGGPLVNLAGEVVGINTAISTRSGGYDGVGFAIPSQLFRWVADQLIQNGQVARPYLGVAAQPLTNALRRQFGIGLGEGALVSQTFPGSPAQLNGILAGDVILEVNGTKIENGVRLQGVVERLQVGKAYPIVVLRNGEKKTLQVTLAPMPNDFARTTTAKVESRDSDTSIDTKLADQLGMTVAELTPQVRESLGAKADVQGVVVTQVAPGGPAAEAGISQGSIIQRVGTSAVHNLAEFQAAVAKGDQAEGILMHITSSTGSRFVVVRPKTTK